MDADIMVAGTVQTDCQVCHSVTVSFLTHSFRHLWLWYFLSLCEHVTYTDPAKQVLQKFAT